MILKWLRAWQRLRNRKYAELSAAQLAEKPYFIPGGPSGEQYVRDAPYAELQRALCRQDVQDDEALYQAIKKEIDLRDQFDSCNVIATVRNDDGTHRAMRFKSD